MGWNDAATTPDLLDVIRAAVRESTLEVSVPDSLEARKVGKVERHAKRTGRQVYDRYLAEGMPAAMAVTLTREYLAKGGDRTTYRVRKLKDQRAWDTGGKSPDFAGLYRGAPRTYNGPSCGRKVTPVAGSTTKTKARKLAEQWRAMRR